MTVNVQASEEAEMLYLTRSEVTEIVKHIDPVAEVRKALLAHALGRTQLPAEAVMRWKTSQGDEARSLVLPGMVQLDDRVAGVKIINANPGNLRHGMRRAGGVTMLFDPETARIKAIMEAAVISALRTAAVSALGVELCCSRPPEKLAIVGAGELGLTHARLFLQRFPSVQSIRLFDIDAERAQVTADLINADSDLVQVASTPESAVRGADVVVPVTTVTEPYIKREWIMPGCTAVNVSLDDFEPDVVSAAETVVVDDWDLIVHDDRRLLGRMQRDGRFDWKGDSSYPAHMSLGDILAGRKSGRLSDEGIAFVNPFGLGIHDVAMASAVYEHATENGLGMSLPS